MKKFRISVITEIIWLLENLFFYPRLRKFILGLSKSLNFEEELIIFDVGANRGQSAIFFRKLFSNSILYCFEPAPKVFKILEKIQSKNITLINKGIGESESTLTFFESDFSESSTFVRPNQSSKWQSRKEKILGISSEEMYLETEVEVTTVDNFINKEDLNYIFWLKIDVEGFELKVLLGAEASLKKNKIRFVQLESHFDDMRGDDSKTIEKMLNENGYFRIKRIKHPFGNFYEDIYGLN